MAGKVIVMLVLCHVFAMAVQTTRAEFLLVEYGKCFKDCHDNCQTQGSYDAFCKIKCDNECMAKKTADKLHEVKQDIAAAGQSAQNADSPINTSGPPAWSSDPYPPGGLSTASN